MGYTHYWYRKQTISPETWGKIIRDVKTIREELPEHSYSAGDYYKDYPIILSGCFVAKKPIFTKKEILFNGSTGLRVKKGKNWEDVENGVSLSHETFSFPRVKPNRHDTKDGEFSFCKTARKPYDLMVCACLIIIRHYDKTVKVSSDGDLNDWKHAITLVKSVLGYDADLPDIRVAE